MSKIILDCATNFSVFQIRKKADRLISEMTEKLRGKVSNIKTEWIGSTFIFSFTVNKFRINGEVLVQNKLITVCAEIPPSVTIPKEQIERGIFRKAQEFFP